MIFESPEEVGDIFYIGDSFSPIVIHHQNLFDFKAVAFNIFEMSAHDIVVLVHIEIKFHKFDDIESETHYLLLFDDLTPRFRPVVHCFWLLFRHQRLQICFFLFQYLNFMLYSGYLSL